MKGPTAIPSLNMKSFLVGMKWVLLTFMLRLMNYSETILMDVKIGKRHGEISNP